MFEQFEGTGIRRWLATTGIPFMLTTGNGNKMVNWTRIFEALLIAGITALVASYITVAKLEVKIDYAKEDRARIEKRVERNEAYMMDLMKQIIAIKNRDRR